MQPQDEAAAQHRLPRLGIAGATRLDSPQLVVAHGQGRGRALGMEDDGAAAAPVNRLGQLIGEARPAGQLRRIRRQQADPAQAGQRHPVQGRVQGDFRLAPLEIDGYDLAEQAAVGGRQALGHQVAVAVSPDRPGAVVDVAGPDLHRHVHLQGRQQRPVGAAAALHHSVQGGAYLAAGRHLAEGDNRHPVATHHLQLEVLADLGIAAIGDHKNQGEAGARLIGRRVDGECPGVIPGLGIAVIEADADPVGDSGPGTVDQLLHRHPQAAQIDGGCLEMQEGGRKPAFEVLQGMGVPGMVGLGIPGHGIGE